jgi:hypothetical protein
MQTGWSECGGTDAMNTRVVILVVRLQRLAHHRMLNWDTLQPVFRPQVEHLQAAAADDK